MLSGDAQDLSYVWKYLKKARLVLVIMSPCCIGVSGWKPLNSLVNRPAWDALVYPWDELPDVLRFIMLHMGDIAYVRLRGIIPAMACLSGRRRSVMTET